MSTIGSNLFWNFLDSFVGRIISLVAKLYLAKLLTPQDFGLVGIAVIFTTIASIISEFGLESSLIQRKQDNLDQDHWDSAFIFSLSLSIINCLVLSFVASHAIAHFYDEPELKVILPILGLTIVFDTLIVTHKARLSRNLQFKRLSIVSSISIIVSSALGVIAAHNEMGANALVTKSISLSILFAILVFFISDFRPNLSFSWEKLKSLLDFSKYILLSRIIAFITGNIDYLLIGKILGSEALGLYTLGYTLTNTIRAQTMNVFIKTLYPRYSQNQNNPQHLISLYSNSVKGTLLIVTPIMLLLILHGEYAIVLFFGEQWSDSIKPAQILSIAAIIHCFGGTSSALIRGLGHAKLETKLFFYKTIITTVPSVTIGAYAFGTIGVCWGVVFHKFAGRVFHQIALKRLLNLKLHHILKPAQPVATAAIPLVGIHFLFSEISTQSLTMLIVSTTCELVAYLAASLILVPELPTAITTKIRKIR